MSIAQGHVFGFSSSQKGPTNGCQEVNHEDMDNLRIMIADGLNV
jgi:hypothetical protein